MNVTLYGIAFAVDVSPGEDGHGECPDTGAVYDGASVEGLEPDPDTGAPFTSQIADTPIEESFLAWLMTPAVKPLFDAWATSALEAELVAAVDEADGEDIE